MSTKVVKKKLTDLPVYTPDDTSSGSLHYREGTTDYQLPLSKLTLLGSLTSDDGFKLIGQAPSYAVLQTIVPTYAGQRILLSAYHDGGITGGGEFMAVSGNATDNGGTICVPTNSNGLYWTRVFNGNRVHVDWFGADPTANTYSSDAFRMALSASKFIELQGSYKYGGSSINLGDFDIKGNGSTVTLDSGTTWFVCTGTIRRPWATDLYLYGGKSFFDFSGATANSYTDVRGFKNINMQGYTGTAIRLPTLDCPWWLVEDNVFAGATNSGTIGLWDNGSDNNIVRGNKFYKNQYHISTRAGSGTYLIAENDFGQFNTVGNTVSRANIWVRVPTTTPAFSGVTTMFLVQNNKFGNENELELDVKLLFANAGSDDFPDYVNYSGSLSASHFIFTENFYLSNGSHPTHWMRSVGGWLPQTFTLENENLQYSDIFHGKYFCYIDNVTRTTPYSIYVKRKAARDSQVLWRGTVSNDPLVTFSLIDPSLSIAAGDPWTHSPYSAGIGCGTKDITKVLISAATYAGTGMSTQSATDFVGAKEAIQGNYSTRYNNIFQPLNVVSAYQPGYIQGEAKIADDATFDSAVYLIDYAASTAETTIYNQFPIQLRKGVWTSFCFPVMFVSGNANHCVVYKPNTQDTTSYPNKVIWSRCRAYLGRTPGLVGVQRMGGLMLTEVPTSSTGLISGQIWVDTTAGNVLKIVS